MALFFKKNKFILLIFLFFLLISFFIVSFFISKETPVRAEERIKIFPTAYFTDWQNPEAVFIQDLSEEASFEQFNKENSAYPVEILTEEPLVPPEKLLEEKPEELPKEETPSQEQQNKEEIKEELPENENQNNENQNLEVPPLEGENSESPAEEPKTESEVISLWQKIKNFFSGRKVLAQEENWQKGESPYLLTDQSLKSIIKVRAVDKAGNERIETISPVQVVPVSRIWKILLILISILAALFISYFWIRKPLSKSY